MDILKHGAEVDVIEPLELQRAALEYLHQAVEKDTTRKMKN
jgi:hypothetical protein